MKSRKVDTITSDEECVRLDIFEGRLPIDEAGAELLRMERARVEMLEQKHKFNVATLTRVAREVADETDRMLQRLSDRGLKERLVAWWRRQP